MKIVNWRKALKPWTTWLGLGGCLLVAGLFRCFWQVGLDQDSFIPKGTPLVRKSAGHFLVRIADINRASGYPLAEILNGREVVQVGVRSFQQIEQRVQGKEAPKVYEWFSATGGFDLIVVMHVDDAKILVTWTVNGQPLKAPSEGIAGLFEWLQRTRR